MPPFAVFVDAPPVLCLATFPFSACSNLPATETMSTTLVGFFRFAARGHSFFRRYHLLVKSLPNSRVGSIFHPYPYSGSLLVTFSQSNLGHVVSLAPIWGAVLNLNSSLSIISLAMHQFHHRGFFSGFTSKMRPGFDDPLFAIPTLPLWVQWLAQQTQ